MNEEREAAAKVYAEALGVPEDGRWYIVSALIKRKAGEIQALNPSASPVRSIVSSSLDR